MKRLPSTSWLLLLSALMAGCATVDTRITLLDPAQKYMPAHSVTILFSFPAEPHVNIAFIESRGMVGGSESELLDDARRKAQAVGADAIVRLEVTSAYLPPIQVYDPWPDYPFHPRYRMLPVFPHPYGLAPFPWDYYRWLPGGNMQTLKAVAIKYITANRDDKAAP